MTLFTLIAVLGALGAAALWRAMPTPNERPIPVPVRKDQ
ncbi:hypothetical protein KDD17_05475 [Sulfitobacter albidus]|uniref:Uncharacterized protein n=1 Tax=Sulfitobacter albidus TaxID=2829501 RepID=A0A975PN36_9RHOB|nr:hypothetical protein KDD17_05475 [Sulfitobacter albidus]